MFPNPLIPGFSPDPSITWADGAYYLATSTFEYLPGIPVYRSTDLASWTHIGNVGREGRAPSEHRPGATRCRKRSRVPGQAMPGEAGEPRWP